MKGMDNIELSLCPFCGGEAEYISKLDVVPLQDESGAYIDADEYYYEAVRCKKCGATIELGEDEEDGKTIEKWNQRGTWIPMSKQMPPVEEWLWVTTRRGDVVKLSLNHLSNSFYDSNDDYWCTIDYVKAWMPYWEPEPYVESEKSNG